MRSFGFVLLALVTACGSSSNSTSPPSAPDPAPAVGSPSGTTPADPTPPSGGSVTGPTASRCTLTTEKVDCSHVSLTLSSRTVAYQTPIGTPPATGWPTVVFFQGSFVPGDSVFAASASDPFGRYELTRTVKKLLDAGYAIVSPNAPLGGTTFWQTNVAPYAQIWTGCADDLLMQAMFDSLDKGDFGPVNTKRLYAMGISSGGFMTSRMAVSYPGKFRALADHSGSYATCGPTCSVPTPLPTDHPPTLFLRGDNDVVVPMSVVTPYIDALVAEGHEAKLVTDPKAGHEWLPEGAEAVTSWFDSHP